MIKRYLRFLVLIACFGLFSACSEPETREIFTEKSTDPAKNVQELLMTHSSPPDSVNQKVAEYFSEQLFELSEGKYHVTVYPDNQLGNFDGGIDALYDGTIELRIGGGSGSNESIMILSWISAMREVDPVQLKEALNKDGKLYQMIQEDGRKEEVKVLTILQPSYRGVTSNREIKSLEDFVGLQMRIHAEGFDRIYWENLNAKCKVYAIDEVYLALQQCVIDAQENTLSVIWGKEIYRQQKYFIHTDHRINVDALYVSSQFYDTLNAEEQSWFQEAADRAAKYAEQEDCEKEYEQKMEAAGIQISREPNVLQAEMREASQTLVLDYLVEEYGEDKVKKIWMMLNDKEGKIPEFPDYEKQETPVRTARNSTLEIVNAAK